MAKLFDPLEEPTALKARREALREARSAGKEASAAEAAGVSPGPQRAPVASLTASERLKVRKDFRLFLIIIWRHLGLPDPTPLQLSLAQYLQAGPDRCILMAFRGAAKSWIAAAFVLWLLWCDPSRKVLVTSASLKRAVDFTTFCLRLLREVPILKHMAPGSKDRQSSTSLDIRGVQPDQAPSLSAKGVNGQITGSRADIIVADDVETSENSLTSVMRDKISEAVKEFDSVLKPGGRVIYLGTPHDEECLYTKLTDRGYSTRIWPALFPDAEMQGKYGEKLAPYILDCVRKDALRVGHTTEPSRFTDIDLGKRRLSLGDSEFTLQYLLDTSLSDRDKYPLKLKELMVLPLDSARGPQVTTWGMGEAKKHLPTMGFGGDYLHAPAFVSSDTAPYTRIVAASDISGRGTDETCMIVMAELNGFLYALAIYASQEGYAPETLKAMASMCVSYGVHQFYYEGNFGDGMFGNLFALALKEAWDRANENRKPEARGGTEMVEVKSSNQASKEKRILSVLEPITQQHRLVLAESLIEADYKLLGKYGEEFRHKYSLMWQYTHVTRERNSLANDDRLETLAMACAPFADAMGIDPVGMAVRQRAEQQEEELEEMFMEADEVAGVEHAKSNGKYRTKAADAARR